MMKPFPDLEKWDVTHKTLHLYLKAAGVIPREHVQAHPKWWHISFTVEENGLVSKAMDLPDGGKSNILLNLVSHALEIYRDGQVIETFALADGRTSTQMGDDLIAAFEGLGLNSDKYAREKFENDEPREYDPVVGDHILQTARAVGAILQQRHDGLEGELSPVQLWPHHFDMSFEWFGTKQVPYEKEGMLSYLPAQLNCGFSFGDESYPSPYFYSNPWPFEEEVLTSKELPQDAEWHLDSWQGTILPYGKLAGDPDGVSKWQEYAQAVYEAAKPTLMA